jgi:hypothetical protein
MHFPRMGRTPNSIKELCRDFVLNDKLIERLCTIAKTAEKESDQIKAIEILMDRGFGKAEQSLDITTRNGDRPTAEVLIHTITALRAELDFVRAGTGSKARK